MEGSDESIKLRSPSSGCGPNPGSWSMHGASFLIMRGEDWTCERADSASNRSRWRCSRHMTLYHQLKWPLVGLSTPWPSSPGSPCFPTLSTASPPRCRGGACTHFHALCRLRRFGLVASRARRGFRRIALRPFGARSAALARGFRRGPEHQGLEPAVEAMRGPGSTDSG